MREMKDSGVEWIGEIPDKWQARKLFYLLSLIGSGTTPKGDEYYAGIGMPWLNTSDLNDRYIYSTNKYVSENALNDYSALQVYKPGSIVIAMYGATIGKLGLTEIELTTNQACCVMNTTKEMDRKFLFYILMAAKDYFVFLSYGAGQPNISQNTIKHLKIPFVNMYEQRKIANYLDAKCSKIDEIIEKQQAIVEKLKEYKLSIINEAVTQGINPDVNMKQSGYKWIGSIPEHWNMVYAKQLFSQRKDRAFEDDEQLTASQKYGIISQKEFMDIEGRQVMQVLKGEEILKHVEKGDFVISMRSFQGGLEYSEVSGKISSAYVMLIPNRDKVCDRYYKWLFKSKKYISALQGTSNLIRDGQALRFSNFVQVYLPSLDLDEQKKIADYLDDVCPKIDNEIEKREKLLEKVLEYKKSLIYEVVTGKKEV